MESDRRRTQRVRLDEPLQDPDTAERNGLALAGELRDTIARERETVRRLMHFVTRTR